MAPSYRSAAVCQFILAAVVSGLSLAFTATAVAQPAPGRPVRMVPVRQSQQPRTEFVQDGPFLHGPSTVAPEPAEVEVIPDQSAYEEEFEQSKFNFSLRRKKTIPANFWIVSFRDCPQSGSPCRADQCTKYFYVGPSGEKTPQTAEDFYGAMRPDVPVCMMVHGSLMEWKQMVDEGHQTFDWLSRSAPQTPFQMVLVTWPSERLIVPVPPIDFPMLGRQGGHNGLYLGRVLSRVPSDVNVSLIGHSHGARLVMSGLHLAGGGDVEGYRLQTRQTPWPRIRVVLAAAAFDHHWLDPDQRYGRALTSTESVLNFRNRDDLALRLYPLRLPFGRESLGRVGFNYYDQQALGPEYAKVRDVEVTSVLGIRHIWPWFYNQPEIGKMLAPYLFFRNDVPAQVTLKPRPRWPFSSTKELYALEKDAPAHQPRVGPGQESSRLVRGQRAPQSSSIAEREIDRPDPTGRSSVTPSAVTPSAFRVWNSPGRTPRP